MLHDLQQQFFNSVYQPQRPVPDFIKHGRLSVQEQIAIYRESILGGMGKALAEVYPVCRELVGDVFFAHMAELYVRQTVSTSPDITCYGKQLADFIDEFEPANGLPYLADVARLEWAWHRAINAPDEPVLDAQELNKVAATDYGQIQLQLQNSVSLLQSPYPILHIWQIHQDEYEGEMQVSLEEGGIDLLVWRSGQALHIEPLSEEQVILIQLLQQQINLEAAFTALLQQAPYTNLTALLSRSLEQGWYSGLST